MKNSHKCSHINFFVEKESSEFTTVFSEVVFTQYMKSYLVFKYTDWLGGPDCESCFAIY